jgi:aspartyl-tRNA(Asn)/glutamyl-tRNA(Gln) amidotransferase subunit B
MIEQSKLLKEKVMIGLEIHAYLDTKSKLFCSCSTDDSIAEPNSLCCPICLGHPGAKPVLNERVVELATKIGLALNCTINKDFFFSRKTYFYPDMSMNYQITQYEVPIAENGFIELSERKRIRIKRAHIEWDPAALVHPEGMGKSNYVLIDYNRSGFPLIEIVTEPDLESPQEAREFLNTLENILSYLFVLKPNTTMKADCNISINYGNRVEIKNVSGFSAAEKALSYEFLRQKKEVSLGNIIEQQTRAFDSDLGITKELRKKETENDYGYIFDPDLVKVTLPEGYVTEVKQDLPEMPDQKTKRYISEFGLSEIDSKILCSNFLLSKIFDNLIIINPKIDKKVSARILTREVMSVVNHDSLSLKEINISQKDISDLVELIVDGKVSDKNVKQAIINYISGDKSNPVDYLKKNNLLISESLDINLIVDKILSINQKAVDDYKNGNEKSLNFLAGLVMRETKGTAQPQKVQELLKNKINQ